MPPKTQASARRLRHSWPLATIFLAGASMLSAAEAPPAASAASAPTGPAYDFRNPPQGKFDDEWMELFIAGQKAGYAHATYTRVGDHILTAEHEEFRVKRLNFALTAIEDSTTEETLDGVPLSFRDVSTMSDQKTVVEGQGDGKDFTITKTVGDYHDTQKVTFPADTLMAWGADRLSRVKGLASGTTYEFLSYSPSDDAFTPLRAQVAVKGAEKITLQDQPAEATRVDVHLLAKSGVGAEDMAEWIAPDFHPLKSSMDLAGMSLDMVASTEAAATAAFQAKDIFSTSLIVLPQDIPPGSTAVTFLLHRVDGQPLPPPPESATEHGEKLADGGVAITLKRVAKPVKNDGTLGAGLPDVTPYLARNAFLDTSDTMLRDLADRAGGPPTTEPVAVAWQLRDFVADYINRKDLSVGFATASEAARSREGDCTEHAVLLAALGRIRGLPARVVSGLAYLPEYEGQRNVLGFHMWTQYYFNGQWWDFDSALTDGKEPYWRLGLVATDLNEVSLSDFSLELMRWMAQLKITISAVDGPPKK